MSVVAWDGKVLAADRRSLYGDTITTVRKIFKTPAGEIVALIGDLDFGMTIKRWYEEGCKRESWPQSQKDERLWVRMIVANGLNIVFYERTPDPVEVIDPFMAWGCGREVALGAMAMGADAVKAVEIASQFTYGCGNGCDWFKVR